MEFREENEVRRPGMVLHPGVCLQPRVATNSAMWTQWSHRTSSSGHPGIKHQWPESLAPLETYGGSMHAERDQQPPIGPPISCTG